MGDLSKRLPVYLSQALARLCFLFLPCALAKDWSDHSAGAGDGGEAAQEPGTAVEHGIALPEQSPRASMSKVVSVLVAPALSEAQLGLCPLLCTRAGPEVKPG